MTFEEKRAWIMIAATAGTYGSYLAVILARAATTPLADVPYVAALLWTVGISIAVSIALGVAVAVALPQDTGKDQRDREIHRFGESLGHWFVVTAAVAALLMAMAELDHFWIANVIYLGFSLSALLSSTAKILAYRRGLQRW